MTLRPLFPSELRIATRVFRATLPYLRISLTPLIGLGNRPFVTTVPPFGAIALRYLVNVGPHGFFGGMADPPRARTLVHELTHVWQGNHSLHSSGFMFGSIACQAFRGQQCYVATPGQPWDSYNPEQQAELIEEWFAGGESESDARFQYVRDNIRGAFPLP